MVTCGICILPLGEDGLKCSKCLRQFHPACVGNRVLRSGSYVCGRCAEDESDENSDSNAIQGATGHSPMGSSTKRYGDKGTSSRERQLLNKIEELEKRLSSLSTNHVETPSANNQDATASASLTVSQADNSVWRSQLPTEIQNVSLNSTLLTREQSARRKAMDTSLPKFSGNPLEWYTFAAAFAETTGDVCGFTPREDMKRLATALEGEALELVKCWLNYPSRLEDVMNRLNQAYGKRTTVLNQVIQGVEALPALKSDLSNIAVFSGQVDHLRHVLKMMGGSSSNEFLVQRIEDKMPLEKATEWIGIRGVNESGTMDGLANFLVDLHDKIIALRRVSVGTKKTTQSPKPRSMHFQEESQAKGEPAQAEITGSAQSPASPNSRRGESKKTCTFKCPTNHPWSICPQFKKLKVGGRWFWVRKTSRCFVCLERHGRSPCKSTAKCTVEGCEQKHHPLLHSIVRSETLNMIEGTKDTHFRLISVRLRANDREVEAIAFLDSGSSITVMNQSLVDTLGLSGPVEWLTLSWADGKSCPPFKSQRVSVTTTNANGDEFTLTAYTKEELKLPINRMTKALLEQEGLAHLPVLCGDHDQPTIIIGQDNTSLTRTLQSIEGRSGCVVASRTPLGWVVEGETAGRGDACLVANISSDRNMETMLRNYLDKEHFGLQSDSFAAVESDENIRARQMLTELTVRRTDGRYETGLLWRTDNPLLRNNFKQAADRFMSFEKKLCRDPELHRRVDLLMTSYVEKGYARRVVGDAPLPNRTWYLPIFTVNHPSKPEKTRIVWDAAAIYRSQSLNSELVSGPDLTQPLINILSRFRTKPFAISGDIEEMFHQVAVREEDRGAQRFLWRANPSADLEEYEMCVLTFGATCSPTLAQYAKNVNAARFSTTHPEAVRAIVEDHYVDDFLFCCFDEDHLVQLARQVRDIHHTGGFRMHKWRSNSAAVLRDLDEHHNTGNKVSLSQSSILGLSWDTTNDLLSFRFRREKFPKELLDGSGEPTKRLMLKVVMSTYDPLGLIANLLIEAKIILREAWREEAGWDDKLTGGIQRRWNTWTQHLNELEDISIPRWHGTEEGAVDLHIFVDASETALAALCYVVQRNSTGRVTRSLTMTKCLVAPLKAKTIPRLELDAAVLGTRVAAIVQESCSWPVRQLHFWTDAKDVLCWLKSCTRRYTTYVANRVSNILSTTTVDQWRWVPTELNPADQGTKWSGSKKNSELWWFGPDFLSEGEEKWPAHEVENHQLLEIRPLAHVMKHVPARSSLVPAPERFSRWLVLVRATSIAVKFVDILKKRIHPGPLSPSDEQKGEIEVLRLAQQHLNLDGEFARSLTPFQDNDGVVRMRGRTANSPQLQFNARFPIVLPNDHHVTKLLILFVHSRQNHQNTTATVNELRQKFVAFNMRATVRRIISSCQVCLIRRTKPMQPQMGELPMCRLAVFKSPFTFTGVDYFGPMNVAVGRRQEKRWVALFTCLTTRAVYLELVCSLSGASCMSALDSLVARRGTPLHIFSDNATCFVAASKDYLGPTGSRPTWHFIPPHSPHMGGAWERLIGMVKRALSAMGLDKTPKEEILRRALNNAERLMNARPLTEIPADLDEEECLTPNHFLVGSSNGQKADAELEPNDLHQTWSEWENLTQRFWERWVNEYLPTLATRSKWREETTPLAIGDIVFICDDDHRRGWTRGVVKEVKKDSNSEQVRQVVVETADKRTFRRAANKIAPIIRASKTT